VVTAEPEALRLHARRRRQNRDAALLQALAETRHIIRISAERQVANLLGGALDELAPVVGAALRLQCQRIAFAACHQAEGVVKRRRLAEIGHGDTELIKRVDANYIRAALAGNCILHGTILQTAPAVIIIAGATMMGKQTALRLVGDGVAQNTQTFDFDFANIARLHVKRRLARMTDTGRGAGDDNVARLQRERLAHLRYQGGDIENQVRGARVLHYFAVQTGLQAQAGGSARKLVSGDEGRAESTGAVEILAQRPLRSAQLIVAYRTVVENRITGDVIECLVERN